MVIVKITVVSSNHTMPKQRWPSTERTESWQKAYTQTFLYKEVVRAKGWHLMPIPSHVPVSQPYVLSSGGQFSCSWWNKATVKIQVQIFVKQMFHFLREIARDALDWWYNVYVCKCILIAQGYTILLLTSSVWTFVRVARNSCWHLIC